MKYRYTKNLGLSTVPENTKFFTDDKVKLFDTPEEAEIEHYTTTLVQIKDNIRKSSLLVKKHEDALEKLNKDFGHLKEKFPEMFI